MLVMKIIDGMSALSEKESTLLRLLAGYVERKQITQQELALATGVHQSQVSRILAGRARRPSQNLLKLCKYAETLDVPDKAAACSIEDIVNAIRSFRSHNHEENQRFLDVVNSLKAWRDSCRGRI